VQKVSAPVASPDFAAPQHQRIRRKSRKYMVTKSLVLRGAVYEVLLQKFDSRPLILVEFVQIVMGEGKRMMSFDLWSVARNLLDKHGGSAEYVARHRATRSAQNGRSDIAHQWNAVASRVRILADLRIGSGRAA
jgi:hypothetical protein